MQNGSANYRGIFNSKSYVKAFEQFRGLSPAASRKWRECFVQILNISSNQPPTIADLACGYGRFIPLLNGAIKKRGGVVYAVDSSQTMIDAVTSKLKKHDRVRTVVADVESWTSPEKLSLAFVSESLHLFRNLSTLFSRVAQQLTPGGSVVIRSPSRSQISTIEWLSDFDLTDRDMSRTPDSKSIIDVARNCGFKNVSSKVIDESCWMPASEYRDMLACRSFSILRTISRSELTRGLQRVDRRIFRRKYVFRNCPTTCIIATS